MFPIKQGYNWFISWVISSSSQLHMFLLYLYLNLKTWSNLSHMYLIIVVEVELVWPSVFSLFNWMIKINQGHRPKTWPVINQLVQLLVPIQFLKHWNFNSETIEWTCTRYTNRMKMSMKVGNTWHNYIPQFVNKWSFGFILTIW